MSGINVRKMTGKDLPRANVVEASLEGQRRVTTWPGSFEHYWRIYEPDLAFCAEMGGELVGFVAGSIRQEERSRSIISEPYDIDSSKSSEGKVGWIEIMGVHADYWGKGIGMALMEAFTEECRKRKASMRILIKDDDQNLKNFLTALKFNRAETVVYSKNP
jgi:GNAT superfamily N-acetyltransferase